MSSLKFITVLVPALNESKTLKELYERTKKSIGSDWEFEFIVIDDGSTDDTFEILEELCRHETNIIAVRHYRNIGKSLALMQGFDMAKGEAVVTIDADLQDHPEFIPGLLEKLEEGYDLVNGWRVDRQDKFIKKMISHLFNILTKVILSSRLHDINCGLKAMRRRVYTKLRLRGDFHRLIPVIAEMQGFRVTEFPVKHSKRLQGKSRYPLIRYTGILDMLSLRIGGDDRPWRSFHAFIKPAFVFFILAAGCLFIWLFLNTGDMRTDENTRVLSTLTGVFGLWCFFLSTIFPLMGLHLDIMTRYGQLKDWRTKQIDKIIGLMIDD